MTGLKVIDGTPTEVSKYLREKETNKIKVSKGKKNTCCDSDLTMERKSEDLFDISKGFMGLYLNKKQAKDLYKWLRVELKQMLVEK